MISFNKTIAYTKSWKHTIWVALILGAILPLLLITLEPFDTQADFSYKSLKLVGYAFCVSLPIVSIHLIENYLYKKQGNRWFVIHEVFYIACTLFLMYALSFLYHHFFISDTPFINLDSLWGFIVNFGLPFAPILIPVWLYLRSKYGVIEVPLQSTRKLKQETKVTISGNNRAEELTINESDFVYARAQQNYVEVYYNSENEMQQKMLRSTLSNIMKQLPNAWQVHRSYLVNLDYLQSVQGNARKRSMTISKTQETIPISQKYYVALQERLSN